MKGSLIILGFFVVGVILGRAGCVPLALINGGYSIYALYMLLFLVGMSIGCDKGMKNRLRALNPRYLLLPIVTIIGTLIGCAVVSFLMSERSMSDCLAVGCGFAYYSISSIIITEIRGAELGTIALLSNIMRELATLVLAPYMVRWAGKLAPIAAGGASTMDTTLPVIAKCSGQDLIVVSMYSGMVINFAAPMLVMLMCEL